MNSEEIDITPLSIAFGDFVQLSNGKVGQSRMINNIPSIVLNNGTKILKESAMPFYLWRGDGKSRLLKETSIIAVFKFKCRHEWDMIGCCIKCGKFDQELYN